MLVKEHQHIKDLTSAANTAFVTDGIICSGPAPRHLRDGDGTTKRTNMKFGACGGNGEKYLWGDCRRDAGGLDDDGAMGEGGVVETKEEGWQQEKQATTTPWGRMKTNSLAVLLFITDVLRLLTSNSESL